MDENDDDEALELRLAANDHEASGSGKGTIYIFDDE
jgi:hypothetical protein